MIYINNKIINQYIQLLLSLICGIFGVLAFSPYDFWPGSIIALTRLIVIALNKQCKQTIWNTLFWGIGFFGGGLHWIYIGIDQFISTSHIISIFLIVLLVMYLTCFPMLFAIFFIILRSIITQWSLIGVSPIVWFITERLRGNTIIGFPWLQFGYTQIDGPIKGLAPILGVEGITFILVGISSLLALSIITVKLFPFIISLILFILITPLSWIKWYYLNPHNVTNIALIQGNISQHLYWDTCYIESILQIYLNHTFPMLGKANIVIWPESAIPGHEAIHNKFLIKLDEQLRKNQTCLITGIIDTKFTKNNAYHYNSIIVLGNTDPYIYPSHNRYNKHHLVLCAEKVPCQKYLSDLLHYLNIPISFMQQGYYLQPQLQINDIKMTAAICYEIIVGHQIRDNFKSDTDFLLTIANNIWFGDSIGPWQHFQMARMRALELGRPVLCGTNTGITAVINADGSIQSQLPQFVSDVLNVDVTATTGMTPYAKFGSGWFFGIMIFFFIYLTFSKKIFKKNANNSKL